MRACVRACVCVCVFACVYARALTFYPNAIALLNVWSLLCVNPTRLPAHQCNSFCQTVLVSMHLRDVSLSAECKCFCEAVADVSLLSPSISSRVAVASGNALPGQYSSFPQTPVPSRSTDLIQFSVTVAGRRRHRNSSPTRAVCANATFSQVTSK